MNKFANLQTARKIRTFATLSALLLLLGAANAVATPASGQAKTDATDQDRHRGHGMGGHLFERWDKDKDGRIAIADLPARMKEHIATVDQDKDGILTHDEFKKGKEQLKALRDKQLDRNGDGQISSEERREALRAHVIERFVEQDKNHDGLLTETELKNPAWEHIKVADANSDSKLTLDELKVAFDEGKFRPRHRGGRGQRWATPMTEAEMKAHGQRRFSADDRNKDGFLVESEVPNRWAQLQVADANKDNRVTFEELTAAFKAGKIRPRGPHHGRGPQGQGQAK